MRTLKCTECGQEFSAFGQNACPRCGCPASECLMIENSGPHDEEQSPKGNNPTETVSQPAGIPYTTPRKAVFTTTDTGIKHENVIRTLANFVFWFIIVGSILGNIVGLLATTPTLKNSGNAGAVIVAWVLLVMPISIGLAIIGAYIVRAWMMLFVNISTNLREINLKTK